MNFVAIDFETANEKRHSPCSLGLTIVKDNQIVQELYWLIKPPELRFEPMNIMIHGIRPSDVENEKTLEELWPTLLPYLEHQFVIAHNASFDFSVLRNTLDYYHIPYPELTYGCTMIMAKQFYSFLSNSKLDTVNRFLGYEFSHHHASADASACANILIQIMEELSVTSAPEVEKQLGLNWGYLTSTQYKPVKKKGNSLVSNRQAQATQQKVCLNDHRFQNKTIALTGPLKSMSRAEAVDTIYRLGGCYSSSVTKKTNMVITNVSCPERLDLSQMSSKLRKAMTLIAQGQSIEIVSEDIFF